MKNTIIGIVIGLVVGVVAGASLIAPRLQTRLETPQSQPGSEIDATPGNTATLASPANDPATEVGTPDDSDNISGTENRIKKTSTPMTRWRMASAFESKRPVLGILTAGINKNLGRISDGTMEIIFFEPDALVPTNQLPSAIASGAIDAAFASADLWSERSAAFSLFSAIPFGPEADEYMAWIYSGGGRTLARNIFHRQNTHPVFCGITGSQAAGWFRRKIRSVDDLANIKFSIDGLGAKVIKDIGGSVIPLQGGDIFAAFETGDIDGATFSQPATDLRMGFNDMVKYYYFPGWQRPASLYTLMVNLDRWNDLDQIHKNRIESICADNMRRGLSLSEADQFAALKELTKRGTSLRRLSAETLAELERSWRRIAASEALSDEDFGRVWDSLTRFRQGYAIWHEITRP